MIKKFYLTRTHTRAMAADHPIGDPTGGAAYGEKNDPITAIISIVSMGATYAAAGSFAAMTLMQGITFAGAALSLIGNVTGNKTLMKIGAIAGIAGGLGMAYDKVMGTTIGGTVGDAFGMEKTAADAALSQTPTAVKEVVPDAAAGGGADVTKAAGYPTAAQANPVQAPDINAGSNLTPINTAPNLSNPAVNPLDPGTNILGKPNPAMSYPPGQGPQSFGPTKLGVMDSLKAGNFADAAGTAGSNVMDMLKTNPTGAYVAAQAIGGVSDWLSGKTDAEIAALKANTGFADAKAQEVQLAIAKEERRRLNMANRYTSLSPQANIKVNPDANARPPGLVASNMQTSPA